jgi:hypothetical protein
MVRISRLQIASVDGGDWLWSVDLVENGVMDLPVDVDWGTTCGRGFAYQDIPPAWTSSTGDVALQ